MATDIPLLGGLLNGHARYLKPLARVLQVVLYPNRPWFRKMCMTVLLLERLPITMGFSDWLNERIDARGISTSQFAAYLDVSHTSVRRWRAGEVIPDPPNCYRIADVLKRDPREVLSRAGHLQLTDEQLEALELTAKLDQVEERFQTAADELRQVRTEIQRWQEQRPEPPELLQWPDRPKLPPHSDDQ